jgi:hypothetical protein
MAASADPVVSGAEKRGRREGRRELGVAAPAVRQSDQGARRGERRVLVPRPEAAVAPRPVGVVSPTVRAAPSQMSLHGSGPTIGASGAGAALRAKRMRIGRSRTFRGSSCAPFQVLDPNCRLKKTQDGKRDPADVAKVLEWMNLALRCWLKQPEGEALVSVTKLLGKGGNGFVFLAHVSEVPSELDTSQRCVDLMARVGKGTPVIKMVSSDGISNQSFEDNCTWEFQASSAMASLNLGPQVYCYTSFVLPYQNRSYGCDGWTVGNAVSCTGHDYDKRVIYFLMIMAHMKGSLDEYSATIGKRVGSGDAVPSDIVRAWAQAAELVYLASLHGRYVYGDMKPENFLVATKHHNLSDQHERVYISDFDSDYLFLAQTSGEALLLNFVLFTMSVMALQKPYPRFMQAKDGLRKVLPRYVLLFMSDMCKYYCSSPRAAAFVAGARKYHIAGAKGMDVLRATLRYSDTCDTTKQVGEGSTAIAWKYLQRYRSLCYQAFSPSTDAGGYRPTTALPDVLNELACQVFLGRDYSAIAAPNGGGIIDFTSTAQLPLDPTWVTYLAKHPYPSGCYPPPGTTKKKVPL